MEVTRTTKVKIDLPLDVARRTVQAWTGACNFISGVAFENGCLSNSVRLHRITYTETRALFGLSAQVASSAIKQVAAKYAAARTAKRHLSRPVFFRPNGVVLQGGERGRDFGFTRFGLSVTTIDGRVRPVAYHGGPKLPEYLSDWRMGDSRLFIRGRKVYLSVSFHRDVEPCEKPNDAVIGVDRGINFLAVATDGKRTLFCCGARTKHIRRRYIHTRASMQSRKAQQNTRSVRRALKRLSGREARFVKNENHVVSRRIVDFAKASGCPTVAIEKLDGIRDGRRLRKPQRALVNGWAFYELEGFIRYKAADCGFEVIEVEPRGTSKGCSRCGYTDPLNRRGHAFLCRACGYQTHADRNAGLNIRLRGILARQALCQDGDSSVSPEARSLSGETGKLLPSGSSH